MLELNRALIAKLRMVSHGHSYKFIEIETKCSKHNAVKLKKDTVKSKFESAGYL